MDVGQSEMKLAKPQGTPAGQEVSLRVPDPRVSDPGLEATWLGTLNAGSSRLKLILELAKAPDGALTGTLDNPSLGAVGSPIDRITLEDGSLRLEMNRLGALYEGRLNEDGLEIEGSWTHRGLSFPLTFKRLEHAPQLSRQPIASRTPHRVRHIHESVETGKLAYYIDRLLSPFIHPSDTLVISGFWRSGTTWLQQSLAALLNAKTVFEPFHPLAPDMKAVYLHHRFFAKDVTSLELYLPYCGDRTLSPLLCRLVDRALRAGVQGGWVRKLRSDVTESFRRRIVLKFVRAHLCLRAAQNTFSMPVIHIYRDPRAVVASIKKTSWDWLFDRLSVREQLLEPQDGRADFFGQWYDEILQYDKEGKVARVTAYWALLEKFVQHSYADVDHHARIVFVSYEELCRQRERVLLETLEKLGVGRVAHKNFRALDVDSHSTSKPRRGASVDERVAGWKKILTGSEIALIESVIQRFGLEDRLVDDR